MPTTKARPDPIIPDHTVLRLVGGGSYGEVWLARAVTGTLRAVKVVWREDFDDERGFEREFQGILKYEPVSRNHPGLVNILHVGRSSGGQEFYYYVMELGDDILSGSEVNPVEYEARTLRSDITRSEKRRLGTDFCIGAGLRLAEALGHLHAQGLAHRDIKPSNVIFVNGRVKLADIGLVAPRGQRTFVGTEGFVAPEGPGTAQADVYSLGKVLYEMATGRDRLDFPELPDDIPSGPERKVWLGLNRIICDVCEPNPARRGIRTARELVEALETLQSGKRRGHPVFAGMMAMLLGAALMWGGWGRLQKTPLFGKLRQLSSAEMPRTPQRAFLKVTSTPDGADVVEVDSGDGFGKLIGQTPMDVLEAGVGEHVSLRILKQGYQPQEIQLDVSPTAVIEPQMVSATLAAYAPPKHGMPWMDQFGGEYLPVDGAHESWQPVDATLWEKYRKAEKRPQNVAALSRIPGIPGLRVHTAPEEAEKFAAWFTRAAIAAGVLSEGFDAQPVLLPADDVELPDEAQRKGWRAFKLRIRSIPYGRVVLWTQPPQADVSLNGQFQGESNGCLLINRIPPGKVELETSLEGYQSKVLNFELKPNATREERVTLEVNKSVVLEKPWDNSLGMRMVPMGRDWMACAWETRQQDFRAYADSTGARMPPPTTWDMDNPGGGQQLYPVSGLSRDECEAFCRWLTEKERREERLTRALEYRLPSDWEWSFMAGVTELVSLSPAQRDRNKEQIFLWGNSWPPPEGSGNFADINSGLPAARQIHGYTDPFPTTSPVGSFAPASAGLYDLAGNVQEWVSDNYSQPDRQPGNAAYGLLRGGDWRSYQQKDLYIGARNPQPPTASDSGYGFRVVLAKRPAASVNEGGSTQDTFSSENDD